jgi:D-alanine-D-alanine ligase
VERYIEGREFSVGLLGNDDPLVLPISEPVFDGLPEGYRPIVSYQAKWESSSLECRHYRRICPAQVEPAIVEAISADCRQAFRAVGLAGYGRIDLRWDAYSGRACILDVNANPDITGYDCLPQMAATFPLAAFAAGMSYPELIDSLIRLAQARHAKRHVGATMQPACRQASAGT